MCVAMFAPLNRRKMGKLTSSSSNLMVCRKSMTCKFLFNSKFPLNIRVRIICSIEFRYSEFNLRGKIILVTYHTTRSVPVTTGLTVVLGVATIISVTMYLTKMLGQLLQSCHDGVEGGVGGGLGCHIPGASYHFDLCCFKREKVHVGDVNVFSEAIKLQTHLSLKLLYDALGTEGLRGGYASAKQNFQPHKTKNYCGYRSWNYH
jgi:hypothetical protein